MVTDPTAYKMLMQIYSHIFNYQNLVIKFNKRLSDNERKEMENRIYAGCYCGELVNFDAFSHIYIIALWIIS